MRARKKKLKAMSGLNDNEEQIFSLTTVRVLEDDIRRFMLKSTPPTIIFMSCETSWAHNGIEKRQRAETITEHFVNSSFLVL